MSGVDLCVTCHGTQSAHPVPEPLPPLIVGSLDSWVGSEDAEGLEPGPGSGVNHPTDVFWVAEDSPLSPGMHACHTILQILGLGGTSLPGREPKLDHSSLRVTGKEALSARVGVAPPLIKRRHSMVDGRQRPLAWWKTRGPNALIRE